MQTVVQVLAARKPVRAVAVELEALHQQLVPASGLGRVPWIR